MFKNLYSQNLYSAVKGKKLTCRFCYKEIKICTSCGTGGVDSICNCLGNGFLHVKDPDIVNYQPHHCDATDLRLLAPDSTGIQTNMAFPILTQVLHFQKPCIQIIGEDRVCHVRLQASTVWHKQPQIRCIAVMRLVIHKVRILHMQEAIT